MDYRKFATYNIAGGIGWIVSMLIAGYLLGTVPIIKENFEKAVLGIILLSILPMIIHFVQEKRQGKSEEEAIVATIAPGLEKRGLKIDGDLLTPASVPRYNEKARKRARPAGQPIELRIENGELRKFSPFSIQNS